MWRKFLTVVMSVVFIFTLAFSQNVNANSLSQEVILESLSEQTGISVQELERSYNEFLSIYDYFSLDKGGNIFFDAEAASLNGVNKKLVNKTNEDVDFFNGLKSESQTEIAANCRGENKTLTHIDGATLYIDHCTTDKIVIALAAGALISTIAAIISTALGFVPVAAAHGVAAALYAFGATYVATVDNGCGLKLRWYKRIFPVSIKAQDCY